MDATTISQEGQSSANPNCLSHIENMVISVHRVHPRVLFGWSAEILEQPDGQKTIKTSMI